MKVVFNKLIPFKGFFALNLFTIMFVRDEYRSWFDDNAPEVHKNFVKITFNHENIHSYQMRELGYVFFYILYFIEWLLKMTKYGEKAYENISFEREAYGNENNFEYLESRKPYGWIKYIFEKKQR